MNEPHIHSYVREAQITYRRTGDVPSRYIAHSQAVANIIRPIIGHRIAESVLVLALDAHHQLLGYHEAARGAVNLCPVRPADIFRYPIAVGAYAIILAHNHPSGDPSPSPEDEALTRSVVEAGRLLAVKVLDHIIVAEDNHYSFLDACELPGAL